MAKKSIVSSVRVKQVKKSAKYMPDSKIDFSDIPEMNDKQLKQFKRVGRPLIGSSARLMIAIRIDPETLVHLKDQAKEHGKGYQTFINEILKEYVKKTV